LVGDLHAVGDRSLGSDAQREGEEYQPDPPQADLDQPADSAADEKAGDKPEEQAEDDQSGRWCVVAPSWFITP
jgi:hypothetical protein